MSGAVKWWGAGRVIGEAGRGSGRSSCGNSSAGRLKKQSTSQKNLAGCALAFRVWHSHTLVGAFYHTETIYAWRNGYVEKDSYRTRARYGRGTDIRSVCAQLHGEPEKSGDV